MSGHGPYSGFPQEQIHGEALGLGLEVGITGLCQVGREVSEVDERE